MAHHAVLLPLILCTPLVSPNYLLPSSPLFGEPMVCLQEGRTRCWPLLLPPALWPFWGCSGLRNLIIDPPPPDPTAVDAVPFARRHDAARPLVDAPPLHRDGGGDGPTSRSPPGILRTLHRGFETARVARASPPTKQPQVLDDVVRVLSHDATDRRKAGSDSDAFLDESIDSPLTN